MRAYVCMNARTYLRTHVGRGRAVGQPGRSLAHRANSKLHTPVPVLKGSWDLVITVIIRITILIITYNPN